VTVLHAELSTQLLCFYVLQVLLFLYAFYSPVKINPVNFNPNQPSKAGKGVKNSCLKYSSIIIPPVIMLSIN
tara:strand:+ start:831 stop:1046 length:216 start_codon:yes stop_codon:yes gene_type:complete